jgi:biotin carboxyl carrier protein
MNLELLLNGQPVKLRLERDGENWRANEKAASVLEVEPGVYSVLIEGRSFQARVESGVDGLVVHLGGRRFLAELQDPRRWSRTSGALRREGREHVRAPMPGKVVRLLAAEGQQVQAGQGLLVIEAMKMQNEIKAPRAGRVVSLSVGEGATVTAGQALAVLEQVRTPLESGG